MINTIEVYWKNEAEQDIEISSRVQAGKLYLRMSACFHNCTDASRQKLRNLHARRRMF